MKITMEYDLPDDDYLYETAVKAGDYYGALCDLQSIIRELYKYSERESIPIEELHTTYYEILNDHNIFNL